MSSSDKKSKIPFFGTSKKKSVPAIPETTTNTNTTSNLGGQLSTMKINHQDSDKNKVDSKAKVKTTTTTSNPPQKLESKDPKLQSFDKVILKANGKTLIADRVVGNGSFGVVVRALIQETNQTVAIKKVLQDKRYKNRELQIMQSLHHPNVVTLVDSFFTNDNNEKPDEVYLNLVLEFVPDTVYRVTRHYTKLKQTMPMIYVKLYTYQLLRSLHYIHTLGVCHRDIKPQNLLLDPVAGILKLCDFGSAKTLVKGEPNVAYICSRYYRAPELIFGATNYTTAIDVWSAGCVMAELMIGTPLFPGDSGIDQLVEIIKVLGTPTKEEIYSMNPNYNDYKFPQIKASPWSKVFRNKTPPEALDLISKLLVYPPATRLKAIEGMAHSFFDELRDPKAVLPNGRPLPEGLFVFSDVETQNVEKDLLAKIIGSNSSGKTLSTKDGKESNQMTD